MLGIDPFGFLGENAEEARIKKLDVIQDRAGRNILRIASEFAGILHFQFFDRKPRDALHSLPDILPELPYVAGAWEPAGHTDDGDSVNRG